MCCMEVLRGSRLREENLVQELQAERGPDRTSIFICEGP